MNSYNKFTGINSKNGMEASKKLDVIGGCSQMLLQEMVDKYNTGVL